MKFFRNKYFPISSLPLQNCDRNLAKLFISKIFVLLYFLIITYCLLIIYKINKQYKNSTIQYKTVQNYFRQLQSVQNSLLLKKKKVFDFQKYNKNQYSFKNPLYYNCTDIMHYVLNTYMLSVQKYSFFRNSYPPTHE